MSSKNSIASRNKIYAVLIYTFRTAALLCANGSLMQTFLSVTGFSEQLIYIHVCLGQAANVLTILLCARFADRGNVIRRAALVQIPTGILFLFYLPLCFLNQVSATAYIWLLLITLFQSVSIALHTICEYKTPYLIYRHQEYGKVLSVCGILSSIVSFGAGVLFRQLSLQYSYNKIMLIAFIISCFLLLLSGGLQYFQKNLLNPTETPAEAPKGDKIPLSVMFRHEAFSRLFIGNLTRGIASGTTTILATVALNIGYDKTLTSTMVSVQSLATLFACALFALISKRIHPRNVILLGSFCYLIFPLLLCPNRPTFYLVMYFILVFGRTLVDYAVPAALIYAVPVEIAGMYNAWRMLLHHGGIMLATVMATFIPLPVLLWISLGCQVISGIVFCTSKVMRKPVSLNAT